MNIAIIDYGLGNLHSVQKALARTAPHVRTTLATQSAQIRAADRILLPGQGAIAACMAALEKYDLIEALLRAAAEKPFLGICIGPQLMMQRSAENGGVNGLGLFAGEVRRFSENLRDGGETIKIPHIGWNAVRQTQAHPLWHEIPDRSRFYYVHSYHLPPTPHCIGESDYGITFPAAIARDNLAGLQAHPEKSGDFGLRFLANFVSWQP